MAEERDIFGVQEDAITSDVVNEVLRMEADAANEAAQILFDALMEIYQETTDPRIEALAMEAIQAVNRED